MNLSRILFPSHRTPAAVAQLVRPRMPRNLVALVYRTPHDGWAAEDYRAVPGDVGVYVRRVGGFADVKAAFAFVAAGGARIGQQVRFIGPRGCDVVLTNGAR